MTEKIPLPDYGEQAADLWLAVFADARKVDSSMDLSVSTTFADKALALFSERFCPVPEKESVRGFALHACDVEAREWLDPRECEHETFSWYGRDDLRCTKCGCVAWRTDTTEQAAQVLRDRYPPKEGT